MSRRRGPPSTKAWCQSTLWCDVDRITILRVGTVGKRQLDTTAIAGAQDVMDVRRNDELAERVGR